MPISDYALSTLFLIFLMLFVLIGTSPAVHRWFDRMTGTARREDEEAAEGEGGQMVEKAPGGMGRQLKDYEAIVFQQLALAGDKGLSPAGLADELHFDRKVIEKALASLQAQSMVRAGGLLGRKYYLSRKGRQRAVQEGMIPDIRSGPGG